MKAATAISQSQPRGRFQGAWQILQFNWPFYLVGGALCVGGLLPASLLPLPPWLRLAACAGIAVAFYWLVASILVSFYVYDVSPLYKWKWLPAALPHPAGRWANIHCGLDETSLIFSELLGGDRSVLDIYNEQEMTEPSIQRARALVPSTVAAQPVDYKALPFDDESFDTIFLIFAAHEIRDRDSRTRFFGELRRVLDRNGSVVLIEHLRDGANFVAFGPGFLHFLPLSEWRRLARQNGFTMQEQRFTPFVNVMILRGES